MDEARTKRDVLALFEYAHNREDWVNPMRDAVAGVTAREAAERPSRDIRSIWQIVLHMTVWSDHVERWTPGYQHDLPEGSTPPLPAVADEAAWEAARERLLETLARLRHRSRRRRPPRCSSRHRKVPVSSRSCWVA